MMINEEHPTRDTYRFESMKRLKDFIDMNGGLYEGDMCPECDNPFERVLLYMEYTEEALTGVYIMRCSGCGASVKDIWEPRDVFTWELTR